MCRPIPPKLVCSAPCSSSMAARFGGGCGRAHGGGKPCAPPSRVGTDVTRLIAREGEFLKEAILSKTYRPITTTSSHLEFFLTWGPASENLSHISLPSVESRPRPRDHCL